MKAFMGYCAHQAKIYSNKGERVRLIEYLLNHLRVLANVGDVTTVGGFLALPGQGVFTAEEVFDDDNFKRETINPKSNVLEMEVCGRKFPHTLSLKNAITQLEKMRADYGKRAEEAAKNSADFKALSHAMRVILEAKEILETGDLVLPLKDATFLRDVKAGVFTSDACFQKCDELYKEVAALVEKSTLPDHVDMSLIEKRILTCYEGELK